MNQSNSEVDRMLVELKIRIEQLSTLLSDCVHEEVCKNKEQCEKAITLIGELNGHFEK